MDYKKHYDLLINRGLNRKLEQYTETHHIIPKCMGGSNNLNNLVNLTPEEHYVAHQLLAKMYPGNNALIMAAQMMIPNRPSNKMYGWLKRKHSKVMAEQQTGEGNSQFGTRWIYNLKSKRSKKIPKHDALPDGWNEGRRINFTEKICCNIDCNKKIPIGSYSKWCSDDCKKARILNTQASYQPKSQYDGKEAEFLELYNKLGSANKAAKAMGYKGNVGSFYYWSKKLLAP